ncbi:MAG: phosphoribosylanthranilate isomerase [Bacteroidota bacterium]|nr:phosphoribosylanthranilate isomerase [Bacteroidota bacterium]
MKIKVCGMRENQNLQKLVKLKPEYVGFIFHFNSPRFAGENTPALPESIKKTGVFVNSQIDFIEKTIKKHGLQSIQLHGDETPNFCQLVKSFGVEVIKAISILNNYDFKKLIPYEKCCNYFLFDTKGKLPGGNGYAFDWKILKDYTLKKPFFLSGGIGPEHVSKIKKLLKMNLPIYAIDINSKFEKAPGLKKIELIKEFKNKINEL